MQWHRISAYSPVHLMRAEYFDSSFLCLGKRPNLPKANYQNEKTAMLRMKGCKNKLLIFDLKSYSFYDSRRQNF